MKYKGEEVSMSIKKEKKKIRDIKQSQLVSSRQTTNSPTVVDQKTQIVVGQETKNITMAKIKKELERNQRMIKERQYDRKQKQYYC